MLSRLEEAGPLDDVAAAIQAYGCRVKPSFYSGDRAALLEGVKLEE